MKQRILVHGALGLVTMGLGLLASGVFGQSMMEKVIVTEDSIVTPHDTIPRFKGLMISQDTTFDQPRTEGFIEIADGATLTVAADLTVNTITTLGKTAVFDLKPGVTLTFEGPIADVDGLQFGLGIINLGTFRAHGTPVQPWRESGQGGFIHDTNYSIKVIGVSRAHTMSIGEGVYDLEYVHLDNMGRTTVEFLKPVTNQIGRYPLHIHRTTGVVSRLRGCLITNFRKWGCAIHGSQDAHVVEECVAVGQGPGEPINGSAYVTESGTEYGATFRRNLAVNIHGLPTRGQLAGDEGFEGNGFWFHSLAALTCEDNVATDCGDAGFSNFTVGSPGAIKLGTTVITGQSLIPKSWKRNTAIRCKIGLDQWPEFKLFEFEDQTCDRCNVACRLFGGNLQFRNPRFLNCATGYLPFGYAGIFHAIGGEIAGCTAFGGGPAFDTLYEGIDFHDNKLDLSFGGLRWSSSVVVELPKVPVAVMQFSGDQFFGQVSERWDSVENRVLQIPEGTFHMRSYIEFPDQKYPDGGFVFVEPTTVQQAWDQWHVGINGWGPPDLSKVRYFPTITQEGGRQLACFPLTARLEKPLKAYVGKVTSPGTANSIVYTMFGGANQWNQSTDRWEIWVDGVKQLGYQNPPVVHFVNTVGRESVELRLFRNNEMISSHSRSLGPTPPPDPAEQELAELRARKAALESEISAIDSQIANLQQQKSSKQSELNQVNARIAELGG